MLGKYRDTVPLLVTYQNAYQKGKSNLQKSYKKLHPVWKHSLEFQHLFWTNSYTTGLLLPLQLTNKNASSLSNASPVPLFHGKWEGFWPRWASQDLGSSYHKQYWKVWCNQHIFTFYLKKCCSFSSLKSRLLLLLFVGEEEYEICFPQSKRFERRLHSCQYLLIIVFYGYPSPHSSQILYFFSGCHIENINSYPHIIKTDLLLS